MIKKINPQSQFEKEVLARMTEKQRHSLISMSRPQRKAYFSAVKRDAIKRMEAHERMIARETDIKLKVPENESSTD